MPESGLHFEQISVETVKRITKEPPQSSNSEVQNTADSENAIAGYQGRGHETWSGRNFSFLRCSVCGKPVPIEAPTDEHGKAVHDGCYLLKLKLEQATRQTDRKS